MICLWPARWLYDISVLLKAQFVLVSLARLETGFHKWHCRSTVWFAEWESAFRRERLRSRRVSNVQRVEKVRITYDHVVGKAWSCCSEDNLKSKLVRNPRHDVLFQRKLQRINYETVAQAAMLIKFSEVAVWVTLSRHFSLQINFILPESLGSNLILTN